MASTAMGNTTSAPAFEPTTISEIIPNVTSLVTPNPTTTPFATPTPIVMASSGDDGNSLFIILPLYAILAMLLVILVCELYRIYDNHKKALKLDSRAESVCHNLETMVRILTRNSPPRGDGPVIGNNNRDRDGPTREKHHNETPANININNPPAQTGTSHTGQQQSPSAAHMPSDKSSSSNDHPSKADNLTSTPKGSDNIPEMSLTTNSITEEEEAEIQELNPGCLSEELLLSPKIAAGQSMNKMIDDSFDRLFGAIDPYRDMVLKQKKTAKAK